MRPLQELRAELDSVPGVASVYFGPLSGPPRFARAEHELHYAASTMKVGVMVAAWQAVESGQLTLEQPIRIHNDHASQGLGRYANDPAEDSDDDVWAAIGGTRPLVWLITRMIVRSSNLATNLVLGAIGDDFAAVNKVWRDAGASRSHTDRGIEDYRAREAGITNQVTAADLALLMGALARGELATAEGTAAMLEILCAQQMRDDLHRGLPDGVRVALKNGWVDGERHSMAVVFPEDAEPFVVGVCTSSELSDEDACAMLGRIAKASWEAR